MGDLQEHDESVHCKYTLCKNVSVVEILLNLASFIIKLYISMQTYIRNNIAMSNLNSDLNINIFKLILLHNSQ